MIERKAVLVNKLGLHARASTQLTKTASRFASEVHILFDGKKVNGKSIMAVMTLGAGVGSELNLQVKGDDQQTAMDALCELIADRFGEDE